MDIPGEQFGAVATAITQEPSEVDAQELLGGVVTGVVHKAVRWVADAEQERLRQRQQQQDEEERQRQWQREKEEEEAQQQQQQQDAVATGDAIEHAVATEGLSVCTDFAIDGQLPPILTPNIDSVRSARGSARYE